MYGLPTKSEINETEYLLLWVKEENPTAKTKTSKRQQDICFPLKEIKLILSLTHNML